MPLGNSDFRPFFLQPAASSCRRRSVDGNIQAESQSTNNIRTHLRGHCQLYSCMYGNFSTSVLMSLAQETQRSCSKVHRLFDESPERDGVIYKYRSSHKVQDTQCLLDKLFSTPGPSPSWLCQVATSHRMKENPSTPDVSVALPLTSQF